MGKRGAISGNGDGRDRYRLGCMWWECGSGRFRTWRKVAGVTIVEVTQQLDRQTD